MAVWEQSSAHPREKVMKTDNNNDKKVHLVAQELKLARVLAGNNKTARDKALKSLKKWFTNRSKTLPFTDNDFQIIWKGLYYSMWMSDKPLIQEECAENIASLIHFETFDESLLFFKAGLTILINEWFGIDYLRLDKFLMLVRRLLRHMLMVLKEHGFGKKNIDKFSEVIYFTILNTNIRPPVSLFMHFTEIFLEEVAKITNGNIPSERIVDLIRPFVKKLAVTSDGREIAQIRKFIFIHLMKQSDLGLQYQAKYEAWKKEGFPGTIDSMQKIKLDEDEQMSEEEDLENKVEEKEKPLDPRAGRVDVELPQLKFKAKDIVKVLEECKFDKDSNSKSRKTINELIDHFTKMSKGIYTLGTKRIIDTGKDSYDTSLRKATNRLFKFETKLMGKDKNKRKRSKENVEEKEEIPQKRKRSNPVEESTSVNGDEVTEDELAKFIAQSEGNLGKKTKKNKAVKRQHSVDKNAKEKVLLNGDDTTGKELEGKKIKKKKKNVEEQKPEEEPRNLVLRIRKVKNKNAVEKQQSDSTGNNPADVTVAVNKNTVTIERTKGTRKTRKNRGDARGEIIDNIECVFERNSGTWVVYDVSRDKEKAPSQKTEILKQSLESPTKNNENPSTSSTNPENSESVLGSGKSPSTFSAHLGSPNNGSDTPSKNKASSKRPGTESNSPKSGVTPVRLFESPQEPKELFPRSAWDEPLQEGEYEICIPAKKHIAKLKRRAKKNDQNLHELINTSMKQIRGKSRLSLNVSLVKNPFSTPGSAKKVKINTKLNKSQEIHEHVQQILSSPGIPYDANKKPLKPLLKASASSTPVNPFYNKQLTIW